MTLFIGGTADGTHRRVLDDCPWARVHEAIPMPVGPVQSVSSTSTMRIDTYTRRRFRFPDDKKVDIFVIEGMSDYDAFMQVIGRYGDFVTR